MEPYLTILIPSSASELPKVIDLFGRDLVSLGYSFTDVHAGADPQGRYVSMTIIGYRHRTKDDGTPESVTFELLPVRRTENMRLMDGDVNILEALRVSDIELVAERDMIIMYRLKLSISSADVIEFLPQESMSRSAP